MSWNPNDITPRDLHALREAAEQAWGDDTRHPKHAGHPLQAQGQCRVTAEWLASRLGGHVGIKSGHYFWVSPDKTHAIDLTGDRLAIPPAPLAHEGIPAGGDDEPWHYEEHQKQWRPGPVIYKRSSHPLFKNFRIMKPHDDPRSRLFKRRADAALDSPNHHITKVAIFGWGGDAYPGETPQAIEDRNDQYFDDEPEAEPGLPIPEQQGTEYQFFYGNGQLHVSPTHDHDELRGHAGLGPDHQGPVAQGYVLVNGRNATWSVDSNVGANALARILQDYTKHVGWRWGGMTDQEGEPIGTGSEFAPKKSMFYAWDGDHLHLGHNLPSLSYSVNPDKSDFGRITIAGKIAATTVFNHKHAEAVQEWARDEGLTIVAEYPGGGNMMDRMRHEGPGGESLEMFDRGNPLPTQLPEPEDQQNPAGQFKCPECGKAYPDWEQYMVHKRDHQFSEDQDSNAEDESKFPDRPNFDTPLPPHFWDRRPFVDVISSVRLATITDPDEWIKPLLRLNGWTRVSLDKWAQGQGEPKDMIEDPIPFIYDIQKDKIFTGVPGQRTSDIPGKFTPGGIVEGEYQPGGKAVIRSATNMPYSVRHLLDLWYWSFPHMELTGIDQVDDAGNTTKLAANDVGGYIKQLAYIDPAAANAWQALKAAGGHTYIVGGAVRDTLLGREPKDLDMMVQGVPADTVRRALEALPGKVDLTGKDFGVFRYRTKGHEVEIALPRTETSTGDKRKDFDVQVDHTLPVDQDLQRRDFTVNSMAVDLDSGKLIDPYGGANDIEDRQLRTTHPKSFEEDATRLVRALVASSRHGLQPTESLRREIEQNAYRLDGEARERIQAELDKLFTSSNPAGAIRLAQETGLLSHIFPDLAENFDYDQRNPHHSYPLGDHSLNVLEGVQGATDDPDLRLAGLLHDVGKPASAWDDPATGTRHYYQSPDGQGADHAAVGATMAERWMRDMKYPVSRINRVRDLIQHHMYPDFSSMKGARKFLNRTGEHADDLMTLRQYDREGKGTDEYQATKTPVDYQRNLVEQVRAEAQPTNVAALAVNGNDLIQAGISPGPQMGKILQQLTDAVLEDPSLNNPQTLTQLALQYSQQS